MAATVPVTVPITVDPGVKPGYLSTEFYVTLLTQALGVFVFVWTAVLHHQYATDTLTPLIPIAGLLAAGVAQVIYSIGRAHVKIAGMGSIGSSAVTVLRDPNVLAGAKQADDALQELLTEFEAMHVRLGRLAAKTALLDPTASAIAEPPAAGAAPVA